MSEELHAMNHFLLYDYENIHFDCDCGLLKGSGVAFQHTKLDRLSHSRISMGSISMFHHKYGISFRITT